jgi:predicted secreted protein
MTASSGIAALGTTITWDSNLVKEMDNIDVTGSNGEEIDITNHDSADQYKEFVMGLLDGGTITMTGNFVPTDTGQADCITDHYARKNATWLITYPDTGSATITGSGYVKSFRVTAPVAGKLGVEFVIRITGKATFAA